MHNNHKQKKEKKIYILIIKNVITKYKQTHSKKTNNMSDYINVNTLFRRDEDKDID